MYPRTQELMRFMRSKLVEEAALKPFLDLAPDTRELLADFYNRRAAP